MSIPASTETCFRSRISGPWSQVSDTPQRLRQGFDLRGERVADLLGLVTIGQVQQHRVTGLTFDQGADRGLILLADDQIPLVSCA